MRNSRKIADMEIEIHRLRTEVGYDAVPYNNGLVAGWTTVTPNTRLGNLERKLDMLIEYLNLQEVPASQTKPRFELKQDK